jgi:hypothetical protein
MRRTQVHGTLTKAPALARADDLRLREELRAQHDGGRKVSWSACRALGLGRTASAQTWQSGEIARLLDAIAGVVHHAWRPSVTLRSSYLMTMLINPSPM